MANSSTRGRIGLCKGIACAFVAFVLILPMLAVVLSSFGENAYATFPPQGFTLEWYTRFEEVPGLLDSLLYSFELAIVATVVSVLLAFATGIGLTLKTFPGKSLLVTFMMSPLILPSIVVGLALLLFFSTVWMADYFTGLIVGHVIISFPYALRSILPALETFDRNLWSASRTLGANPWKSFLTILVPAALPGLVSATIFAFLVSFDNYNISAFIQDPVNPTLPVVLYNAAEQALSPVLMAISSVLIAMSAIIVSIFSQYLLHGK